MENQKSKVGHLYKRLERHWRTLRPKTINNYQLAWGKWLIRYEDQDIRELDMDDWQDLLDEMTEQNYSRSAQHQVRTLLSQIYKVAMGYGLVQTNVARSLYLEGRPRKETLCFTQAQLKVLREHADKPSYRYFRTCRIVLIMCYTGLRPQELFTLPLDAIDFKEGYIRWGMKTKAGRNRIVPILPAIEPYIMDEIGCFDHPYLLRGQKSEKINLKNWRKREFYPMTLELGLNSLEALLDKKHVPHITPYSARHTFATMAKSSGVDAEALIQIMGHTTINTTNTYYLHEDLAFLKSEAEKIEG